MQEGRKLWTRDELILALNLYLKLPFGKLHSGTPEIIHLANILGRTAGSIAMRLNNFPVSILFTSKEALAACPVEENKKEFLQFHLDEVFRG